MEINGETAGDRDITCLSLHRHDGPHIKGLYAEALRLRDMVLRRLVGIGCKIDEKSLPKAQAIINANIGELVAVPEYATLLDRPGGESRILALLIRSCATEIGAKMKPVAEKRRKAALRAVPRGTPLRLVTESAELR
jgi:hypothetical protein